MCRAHEHSHCARQGVRFIAGLKAMCGETRLTHLSCSLIKGGSSCLYLALGSHSSQDASAMLMSSCRKGHRHEDA